MQVVIIGAGYAGTTAANRLSRKSPDAQITVVNARSDFVERVRLHEHLAGTGTADTPLEDMLRKGIATRVANVDKVDDGVVILDSGEALAFDHAFIAVGSSAQPLAGTIPIGTWEGAERAKKALTDLAEGASVTVIGGGLTGIETAAEVAEARRDLDVSLVAPTVAATLSPGARARVLKRLARLGVEIVTDAVESVGESTAVGGRIHLRSGAELASDLALWAIVGGIPDLAARSGLAVNDQGQALVDPFLRSVTDPRIFVVGDCAAVPGARLCCATAAPQGAHAADTLARLAKNKKIRPHSMGYVGQALSLGRHDGIMQLSRKDDSPRSTYFAGRTAALSKEIVSRYAKFGSRTAIYAWASGPRTPA